MKTKLFPWYRIIWNLLWWPVGVSALVLFYVYECAVKGPKRAVWPGL